MMDSLSPTSISQSCETLQHEEYEVLESIYPEYISRELKDSVLKLEIPIEFSEPRVVHIVQDGRTEPSTIPEFVELSLSSLPSLLISLSLPETYPLECPPELTSVRASHVWLPHISQLHKVLLGMWQPGEGVLYSWVEFLRQGEFLRLLSLWSSDTQTEVIRIPHTSPPLLAKVLKESDANAKLVQFAQSTYPCSICLGSVKGSKCVQLSCGHVFCRSCLEEFWKLCITEGEVGRVGCPDPVCVKVNREANAEEVARVVSESELKRWRWLWQKVNLERDPSIIHCPMEFCQAPVPKPTGADETSGYERLRTCPKCTFSFCAFCRRTWHGPVTGCQIAHSEKLVLEYLSLEQGSTERHTIERRYGKANIMKLVAHYEEEQANKKWLEASTRECPGCQVHVEKSLGCNHMTCAKCRQHFCYRCGARVSAKDPYSHFTKMGHSCYDKLFD